jgi:hypothetical protein
VPNPAQLNLHHLHEAEPITKALIRERLSARDRFIKPLIRERDAILAATDTDASAMLIAFIDCISPRPSASAILPGR